MLRALRVTYMSQLERERACSREKCRVVWPQPATHNHIKQCDKTNAHATAITSKPCFTGSISQVSFRHTNTHSLTASVCDDRDEARRPERETCIAYHGVCIEDRGAAAFGLPRHGRRCGLSRNILDTPPLGVVNIEE